MAKNWTERIIIKCIQHLKVKPNIAGQFCQTLIVCCFLFNWMMSCVKLFRHFVDLCSDNRMKELENI